MSGPLSLQGAMSAARTAVDASATEAATASQNIANAATPGYARERVSLEALANNAGVAATTIQRLVSPVIRAALVHAQGASATATAEAGFLGQIQALLGEPSQGLSSLLSSFWNAWQGVAATPSDLGARNALLSAATQLTAQFHALASGLTGMAQALAATVADQVAQVNTLAQQVASLNAEIAAGQAAGQDVNALADQRDQLIQRLAQLVGAEPAQVPTSDPTLVLGGQPLVVGDTAYLLRASASGGTVSVTWAANGQPVPLTGGEVGAELQTVTQTIPAVLGQLNSLALSLIQAVNAQHQVGYTLDSPPRTGLPFFQGTGAADIALAPAVASTPLEIAASSSGAPNDGANAQAIAALATTPLASGTTIAQQYNGIVVSLGAQLATATQQQTTASAQVAQFQQLDQSVSGVSLTDEQLALLLDQQQSQAASSVLQAVKAMLQSLLAAVGA
jgi:flagellar hook-associated protein 1 FlgK